MDAKNLMDEVSSRVSGLALGDVYRQGEEFASHAAERARDLYRRAEDRLPEGSLKYAGLALAGLTIGAVAYRLGKSRERNSNIREPMRRISKMTERASKSADESLSSAKEEMKSTAQSVNKIDFTPVYKLAKLWLIYKISL